MSGRRRPSVDVKARLADHDARCKEYRIVYEYWKEAMQDSESTTTRYAVDNPIGQALNAADKAGKLAIDKFWYDIVCRLEKGERLADIYPEPVTNDNDESMPTHVKGPDGVWRVRFNGDLITERTMYAVRTPHGLVVRRSVLCTEDYDANHRNMVRGSVPLTRDRDWGAVRPDDGPNTCVACGETFFAPNV